MKKLLKSVICGSVNSVHGRLGQQQRLGKKKKKKENAERKNVDAQTRNPNTYKATFILAASGKTSFSTPTDWSTSISKLRTKLNGEFKFGAKPDNKMGNQLGWVDYGDSKGDCRGNPSLPNTPMGWFNVKLRIAWMLLFPLTSLSTALGFLPLTNLAWGQMEDSWLKFHSNTPEVEEMSKMV